MYKSPLNMAQLWSLLAAMMVTTTSAQLRSISSFTDSLGKGITKEIAAVKQPIDETITYVGSTQCSNVKKLFGVDYEQVQGVKEPDLNQLTLNFISRAVRVSYNLSEAAKLIPLSRDYNPLKKQIIYIHGFTDDPTKDSFTNINEAFLSKGEYNILALDGSSLIRWLYLRSTTYVRFMAEKLGSVLAAMVHAGQDPSSIHLIGHSLGSHIAGFTGKTFTNLTGHRVGRISSLDPAGPCFSHVEPELRLKASDADFVDVVHTDGGVYGLKEPVGHVDFYPNSGSQQPNCFFQTCSHSRAWELYAESVVNPTAFPAVRCKNWEAFRAGQCDAETKYMGYACSSDTRGNYFLQTADSPPYGLGPAGVIYKNNEGLVRNIGAFGSSILG